jgi:hypothetical protein
MLKRDFGILFLAACAVFLSIQNEGPFTFEKAWCGIYAVFLIALLFEITSHHDDAQSKRPAKTL